MVAKLVIEEGDLKGLSLSLEDSDSWTIGRDPEECQLVIEDPLVSRRHMVARRTPEGIVVENLSTTNSVQINDEEIDDQPRLLQNGDTLKIGNEILRYYEDSSAHILDDEIFDDEILDDEIEHTIEEDLLPQEDSLLSSEEIEGSDEGGIISQEDPLSSENPPSQEDVSSQTELPVQAEPVQIELEESDVAINEDPESQADTPSEDEMNEIESDAEKEIPSPLVPPSQSPTFAEENTLSLPPENSHASYSPSQPTIFAEEESDIGPLAEIDFGIIEAGRWLLKVVGGTNVGAEFHMQGGSSYILGTDPQSSDIVFHDTSVSRQHAKITITPEDTLMIEDLNSRNGVLMGGSPIESPQSLPLNTIVTLGTTSFVIYDREGEMQTIISPLLPSIVKVLQQEPLIAKPEETSSPISSIQPDLEGAISEPTPPTSKVLPPPKPQHSFSNFIIATAIVGLFTLAGMGTYSLFKSEPIVNQTQENADELIQNALQPFPAIRYTFNKGTGGILLLGHVINPAEKNQLLFNLQSSKFIKSIDDSGIIIDESVWHEVNSILSENPAWKGITIYSPKAGQFVLSGYLQTRKQAEQLSSYISLNFPYLDLLKKQIVVEEDILNQINSLLQSAQFYDVVPKMALGEVTLTGGAPPNQAQAINQIVGKIKNIPGIRVVNNLIKTQTAEPGLINISDHYPVTGKSRIGDKYTVVINGHILSKNDDLDGMTISEITSNRVMLEKDGIKYRIDY